MGTPREYGFNGIQMETSEKHIRCPLLFLILFLYFLPALLVQSDPVVVGGGGHKTGSTQTYSLAHDAETAGLESRSA